MKMKLSRIKNVMNNKLSRVFFALAVAFVIMSSAGFTVNYVNSESEQSTPAPLS